MVFQVFRLLKMAKLIVNYLEWLQIGFFFNIKLLIKIFNLQNFLINNFRDIDFVKDN